MEAREEIDVDELTSQPKTFNITAKTFREYDTILRSFPVGMNLSKLRLLAPGTTAFKKDEVDQIFAEAVWYGEKDTFCMPSESVVFDEEVNKDLKDRHIYKMNICKGILFEFRYNGVLNKVLEDDKHNDLIMKFIKKAYDNDNPFSFSRIPWRIVKMNDHEYKVWYYFNNEWKSKVYTS